MKSLKTIPRGLVVLRWLRPVARKSAHQPAGQPRPHGADRFKDVNVAVKEGYAPIPCASGVYGGAMGIDYVNGDYLKERPVDLNKPEAVMYEPMPDGKLALIVVEYITTKGPASLETICSATPACRTAMACSCSISGTSGPGSRTWLGAFADTNMNVSCEAAKS